MGWPKIPTDEQRANALRQLAELKKSYPVQVADKFFQARDCTDGFYEVMRSEVTKLLRDVYRTGQHHAKSQDAPLRLRIKALRSTLQDIYDQHGGMVGENAKEALDLDAEEPSAQGTDE